MVSYAGFRTTPIFGFTLSLIIVNLAAIMEKADENLLPAVYKEVGQSFAAGPSDLGNLTFIRNLVMGLASPLAGLLVISYNRPIVLAMGTMCWAFSTAAMGVSQYFWQLASLRAVNGLGLAIVIPALQSFIADSYKESMRGAGFGVLQLVGHVGGIGGGALGTVMAAYQFWGIPGWRCAFILMASLSCLIGIAVFFFVVDPRGTTVEHRDHGDLSERDNLLEKGSASTASLWLESWTAVKAIMKVRTFQFIVFQGLIGSLPWTAIVFFTYWFELIGFDNNNAALINTIFGAARAIGSFVGGLIGDRMSVAFPNSGRIMCAQFSTFMGIITSWILLTLIPQTVDSYFAFVATTVIMGLTITWCVTASNGPMFAEVVPSKHRTMIYAFDRAFEISFSSVAAPVVGLISENMYGYNPSSTAAASGSSPQAYALSRGLFAMMAIPFGLGCLLYTPLYRYFWQDRENARKATLNDPDIVS